MIIETVVSGVAGFAIVDDFQLERRKWGLALDTHFGLSFPSPPTYPTSVTFLEESYVKYRWITSHL